MANLYPIMTRVISTKDYEIWDSLHVRYQSMSPSEKILLDEPKIILMGIKGLRNRQYCSKTHTAISMVLAQMTRHNVENLTFAIAEGIFDAISESRRCHQDVDNQVGRMRLGSLLFLLSCFSNNNSVGNFMIEDYESLRERVSYAISTLPLAFTLPNEISELNDDLGTNLTASDYKSLTRRAVDRLTPSIDKKWLPGTVLKFIGDIVTSEELHSPDHSEIAGWFYDKAVIADMIANRDKINRDTGMSLTEKQCISIGKLGAFTFNYIVSTGIMGCVGDSEGGHMGLFYCELGKYFTRELYSKNIDNPKLAWWFFKQAVYYSDPEAHRFLSFCYIDGCGVDTSIEKGIELLQLAAIKYEDTLSMDICGALMNGREPIMKTQPLTPNFQKAFQIIRNIVLQGHITHQDQFIGLNFDVFTPDIDVSQDFQEFVAFLTEAGLPNGDACIQTAAHSQLLNIAIGFYEGNLLGGKNKRRNLKRAVAFAKCASSGPEVPIIISNLRRCDSCHQTPAMKYCGSCFSVRYCDKKCQAADWQAHKKDCDFVKPDIFDLGCFSVSCKIYVL
jgi:hypothetical protein